MSDYWTKTGVRYVNLYGIGQTLPVDSPCSYYLDCPGTPVLPSMKNDFENAHDVLETKNDGVHMTLSMTFPDLANPQALSTVCTCSIRRTRAGSPGWGKSTWSSRPC